MKTQTQPPRAFWDGAGHKSNKQINKNVVSKVVLNLHKNITLNAIWDPLCRTVSMPYLPRRICHLIILEYLVSINSTTVEN